MTTRLSPVETAAKRGRRTAAKLALLAALLYGISFVLPTYIGLVYKGKAEIELGYTAFMMAALSPFSDWLRDPLIFAAFLANPLLWAGGVCFGRERYLASWVTSSLAAGLAAPLWLKMHEWLVIGYYAWILSIVLFAVASAMAWMNARRRAAPHGFEVIVP